MRNLKMICAATVLTLALSLSTFGGEISTPGLLGENGTPGTTQPVPDPKSAEPSTPDDPLTGDLGTPLDAVLMAIAALF